MREGGPTAVTVPLLFQVLFLDHPKKKIRDTQKYKPFKSQVKVRTGSGALPPLSWLALAPDSISLKGIGLWFGVTF